MDLRQARTERGDHVGILVYLAMAEHRLENYPAPVEALERLRKLNAYAEEPYLTLHREVESLLATPMPPR